MTETPPHDPACTLEEAIDYAERNIETPGDEDVVAWLRKLSVDYQVKEKRKMSSHIVNGKFQSDKYPTCPPGKVPLSVEDPMAQDLLWEYAQRRREVDSEFSIDLETALLDAGFDRRGRKLR